MKTLTLPTNSTQARERACRWIRGLSQEVVWDVTVEQRQKTRSLAQNAKMWAMLSDISSQVVWHGQKLRTEEWKDVFSAVIRHQKSVPGIDGGVVFIGARTSRMKVQEIAEMIELMYSFGAEREVRWSEE